MSKLSEGEVHVEAMRLILAEMERREDIPDWTIWQHMLNMLETIFQGIVDQRADDADEIDSLRKELANAQRELSEQGQAHSVELQQETADLQKQLDAARAETVEVRRQRNNETDRLNATSVVSVQQRDEIAYLRARLDEERSVSAGVRQQLADAQRAVSDAFAEVNSVREQLDAAIAAVALQRAGIERLQAFVEKIRVAHYCDNWPSITIALDTLDAATEPTPVAEPVDAEGGQ